MPICRTCSTYFDALEKDVIEHSEEFQPQEEAPPNILGMPTANQPNFHRYRVNLLVDNSKTHGAPVVSENHPSYQNLMGRAEHESRMGTLFTQFTLIKPGALHRANGGYLVLDALKVLQQPFAWDGLKRALNAKELRIESLGESLSLISTVTLEPEPIPLDVKVILVGDRMLYYMLYQHDRDFAELFKVAADFDEQMDRSPENCQLYARYIATMARQEKYRPFDKHAVARVIEESARIAGDSEKLSISMQSIANLLREADYWASTDDAPTVTDKHVELAVDKQVYRANRVRTRVYEQIERGTVMIDTAGACTGQVNGLSVIDMGNFSFGQPSRITATVRIGKGEVIDIEREVDLGGAIHSKGVLILSSFLATRFAENRPLSLVGQPGLRAIVRACGWRQRLGGRIVRAALGTGQDPHPAVVGRHRLRQSTRAGAADRRRERQDRGLLRRVCGTRPDGRAGRADSAHEREASDAATGRRGRRGGREVPRACRSKPWTKPLRC